MAADVVGAMGPMPQPANAFAFRVPGSPVGVNRAFTLGRGRRAITLTPLARDWKRAVAMAGLAARPRGWSLVGAFALEVHSVFVSPLADVDGPVKLVADALQGVAYANDRSVLRTTATKSVDPLAARVEIVVRRLPGGGPTG